MKRLLLSAGFLAATMLPGYAFPQEPPSGGEISQVFACFYECKPRKMTKEGLTVSWQEITTLMVMNMNSGSADTRLINAIFLDGNGNVLGSSRGPGVGLDMSPGDLDEIHVCRTLQANGLPVPQAGIVEFYVVGAEPGGVYAWVKNLIGKFQATIDEPFDGRVTGIAKTECRQVPVEVSTPMEIAQKAIASGKPQDMELILVEGTDP